MLRLASTLEALNISKSYREPLFKNLTLKVPERGLIFIKGPNGSGKSTLLRVLALMEPPDEGEIVLMGEKVGDVTVKDYHKYASYISYSFQEPLLLPTSVEENLRLPTKVSEQKLSELIDRLNLKQLFGKKASKLSGGEKKRVDIARAIIRETPLLFLDEPLSFLDPSYVELVIELIVEESSRRSVLVTATEAIPELEGNASQIVDMVEARRSAKG